MKWLRRLIKFGLIMGIVGAVVAAGAIGTAYYYISPNLPDIEELKKVQLQVPLRVYSQDGELMAEFGEKRRSPLRYEELPDRMVQAITSAEDANFFSHPGVDIRGLLRAGIKLILTGKRKQGGSTITMQVARNFYLTREKTYLRKVYEIFLALRIENELSKQEILELYLNKIYLGHRSYGVGAAAKVYYGKTLDQLSLAETAMIAGLPKAPSRYNPLANPPRAVQRRNYVLSRMHELGHIDQDTYSQATQQPVTAKRYSPDIAVEAPYVAEMVRAEMVKQYGSKAYTGGFEVYTTVSGQAQAASNKALRKALDDYTLRHGYHGAEKQHQLPENREAIAALLKNTGSVGEHLPAIVLQTEDKQATALLADQSEIQLDWDALKWARKYETNNRRGKPPKKASDVLTAGDQIRVRQISDKEGKSRWQLTQVPKVTGALISLAAEDGAILALNGGYDFYSSKFNRVIQAQRQPGSGFKAFVYSAALEKGFTAASTINDAPVVFNDSSLEGAWRPENYSGKFFGPTRLRFALTKSRNMVSIRLLRSIGIKYALEHIERFGFDAEKLPHNLSLSLGSATVTPLQMARGYAVLANGGYLVEPYFIQRIVRNFETVYTASPLRACQQECPAFDPTLEVASLLASNGQQQPSSEGTNNAAPEPTDTVAETTYAPRVISEQNRYLMYSMMQDVVKRGTAVKAKALKRNDIAGKTGTTNEQRDAWFNGFNQSVVTSVWVGFDNNDRLGRGEVGGRAALPAWIDYMRVALADTPDRSPSMPEDMVTVKIDPESGLRARPGNRKAIFEVFRKEHAPEEAEAEIIDIPGVSNSDTSSENSGEAEPQSLF